MLYFINKTLYQTTFAVNPPVVIAGVLSVFSWGNYSFDAHGLNGSCENIGVAALVRGQSSENIPGGQRIGLTDIALLSSGKQKPERIAESVDGYMDFGRESSS